MPKEILLCSYLEPDLVERIRQVSSEVRVHYHPDLIPKPRYDADHVGVPLERSLEQREAWQELMERAEILFDFDYTDVEGMKEHARNVRWIQASSAGIGQFVQRHQLECLSATLTTAAGVHARPLAEFVMWGILTFVKNYPLARAANSNNTIGSAFTTTTSRTRRWLSSDSAASGARSPRLREVSGCGCWRRSGRWRASFPKT